MAKADILMNAGDKYRALHCYIRALRNIGEISICVSKSNNRKES